MGVALIVWWAIATVVAAIVSFAIAFATGNDPLSSHPGCVAFGIVFIPGIIVTFRNAFNSAVTAPPLVGASWGVTLQRLLSQSHDVDRYVPVAIHDEPAVRAKSYTAGSIIGTATPLSTMRVL